jgi:HemY protein
MRLISWLAILAITAVLAAWLFANNQGHITMYWRTYRIDLSMNLFMILGFVGFFIVFNFFKIISLFIELPLRAKHYRQRQLELRSLQELQNSTEHLFAGRYVKSLKSAQVAMGFESTSQVSYMLAAQASHQMKQYEDRDRWLERIEDEQFQTTKLILNAQMLIDQRQARDALKSLSQIQKSGARQFVVQSLAMRAHQILQQWPEMLKIANSLLKKKYLPPALGKARIHEALTQWIKSGRISQDELLKQWNEFDPEFQKNPQWLKLFAQGFLMVGNSDMAKRILDHALELAANEDLLSVYPQCATHPLSNTPSLGLIQKLEHWIQKDPAHPALHLALGQLCQHGKLWGKALFSFQQTLDSSRSTLKMKLSAELGMMRIYETIEDHEKSAIHQKEVLRLMLELHPTV